VVFLCNQMAATGAKSGTADDRNSNRHRKLQNVDRAARNCPARLHGNREEAHDGSIACAWTAGHDLGPGSAVPN
jgi:hypothetical protein